jgi:hypothetical protein
LVATCAAIVGLDMALSTYPGGRHVRDIGQVRLMARLEARIGPGWRWAFEVPLPIPGDPRAWDAVVTHLVHRCRFGLEAITRIHDLQAELRRTTLKERDGGLERTVLLVADTRINRLRVDAGRDIIARAFPCGTRAALAALGQGALPPQNALVLL